MAATKPSARRIARAGGAFIVAASLALPLVTFITAGPAAAELVVPPAVTATIAVGGGPLGVATHATRNLVYSTNNADDTVSVIDGATNTVLTTIPLPPQIFGRALPTAVATEPSVGKAYVANFGPAGSGHIVSVIDETTQTITGTIDLTDSYKGTRGIATDPALHRVHITGGDSGHGGIVVIDSQTDTRVGTVTWPSPVFPSSVAVDPVTHRIYVSNDLSSNGTVAVLDGLTDTWVDTVLMGALFAEPAGLAVDPTSHDVYVANYGDGNGSVVWVIDGATNTLETSIGGMPAPSDVAVDTSTRAVFAANIGAGGGGTSTTIIDGTTNTTAGTVTVGGAPAAIAVNSVTHTAYVANSGSRSISVINVSRTSPPPSNPTFGIATTSLPQATAGQAYNTTLNAVGAAVTPKWKKVGKLPKGLKLNTRTGTISGTPKTPGTTAFSVRAQYKVKVPHHPATLHSATVTLSITVH